MEANDLKKVLVDFLVEVILEVKARTASPVEDRIKPLPEEDRKLIETRGVASEAPLPAMPRFISMKQAAKYWGASTVGFRRMLDRLFAELPKGIVVRVGKRVHVDIRAFESWLVAKEVGSRRRS